jgi:Cdc6-like AAA superfamily ATPase
MFRRNQAFRSGILEDSELNIIADIVEETKSMRTGIDIMQYSGLYCDRFHYTRITYNIIEFAKMDINPNLRPEFIDNLKDHAIIILFAIARLSKIRKTFISSLNQIFEFYQSVCSELNITSVKITAFKRHMKELSEQRIISMKLHNSSKGNRGRKEMVTLNERKDILEICENKIKNAN